MKRKIVVLKSMVFILSLLAVSFVLQPRLDVKASTTNLVSNMDILRFPVDNYTEEMLAVNTSAGQSNVTYRLYRHIAYVANPVDVMYESLDVGVPVKIDGQDIDATNAPILIAVDAGGYISSRNNDYGVSKLLSVTNVNLSLAAGYVVVLPGLRGHDRYYGKAPADIVDLKAVVRYIHYNRGVMPGNSDWIIASGISGGGALSTLLGVSGNSHLFDTALEQIGAANASDNIFASAPYCPITDLDHADMAYEWELGTTPYSGSQVNQSISQQLKNAFSTYQISLNLQGKNGYGILTADNYGDYLVKTYLIPSANKYLSALTNESRVTYLSQHVWITWSNNSASFTFADYVAYIGRSKKLPAFDTFDLTSYENSLFGNSTTNRRHFTNFSLQQASGNANATIDADLPMTINMMNPMYFIQQNNSDCAKYWFIRTGTKDTDTSHVIFGNLAAILENRGKTVDASLYWDAGHGVNLDPEAFVAWVKQITNYSSAIPGMWSRTYGGANAEGWDNIYPLAFQTSDGGFLITGSTTSYGAGSNDAYLVKTDANGNMQWQKTYGGPLNESACMVCKTSDSGYAIMCTTNSYGAGGNDFWLLKTDANGNLQWNKTYGGTGVDNGYQVYQTASGGYILFGETNSFGAGGYDLWVVKTDAAGNMQWNKTYGATSNDMASMLILAADGGYAVASWSTSFGGYKAWLVKTDSSGNMLWNKTYSLGAASWANTAIQTADGGYAMIGVTVTTRRDAWLVKTDSSGNMLWNKTYGGTGDDTGWNLVQKDDEGFAIVGVTSSFGAGGVDGWLIMTDSSGNMLWNRTYGGAGTDITDSIIRTSDGGYAMAGFTDSFGAGSTDLWLIKTDASGVIPESLTIEIVVLLSTFAVVVSTRYVLKRPKINNSSQVKL